MISSNKFLVYGSSVGYIQAGIYIRSVYRTQTWNDQRPDNERLSFAMYSLLPQGLSPEAWCNILAAITSGGKKNAKKEKNYFQIKTVEVDFMSRHWSNYNGKFCKVSQASINWQTTIDFYGSISWFLIRDFIKNYEVRKKWFIS